MSGPIPRLRQPGEDPTEPGDTRPMWQTATKPPDPLVDALRDFASAVRDLAAALRESTSERGQFRQLIPEDTDDAELDPDLDGHS